MVRICWEQPLLCIVENCVAWIVGLLKFKRYSQIVYCTLIAKSCRMQNWFSVINSTGLERKTTFQQMTFFNTSTEPQTATFVYSSWVGNFRPKHIVPHDPSAPHCRIKVSTISINLRSKEPWAGEWMAVKYCQLIQYLQYNDVCMTHIVPTSRHIKVQSWPSRNFSRVLLLCKPFTSSSAAATPRLLPFSSKYFNFVLVASLSQQITKPWAWHWSPTVTWKILEVGTGYVAMVPLCPTYISDLSPL